MQGIIRTIFFFSTFLCFCAGQTDVHTNGQTDQICNEAY